ncbi:c-type cytochrome biogenesis protein CcmI [Bradyrhizobium sp.]|uniref:c-type cytochrome biogenesis protein CcmI n=1 Tax=Bradyrhizobium sp. TaxID=376 RepID=UPI002BA3D2F8|nr:c-type cytochrome biogenesis protein CcmI [Bradyrhizobium sp.]HMM89636.1 c-type cytochrome biogenesis protein CcmI [Bradyrhizobium sp.]
MTLWFVFALMTVAAIFAVLWPLSRTASASGGGNEAAVYKDQLAEVERDATAGLIGVAEAEAARVEIGRRLLAAADGGRGLPSRASLGLRRVSVVAALIGLPVAAVTLYLSLGSPLLPDFPLASRTRTADANQPIENMVAQVEAHLEKNPTDGRGWTVLAPVLARLGRFEDSVRAYRNAIAYAGDGAERRADLGEALAGAAGGVVTAEAKAEFERAVAQNAEDPKANYFLGLAAEQDGRQADAAGIWRGMLAKAPADAPWRPLLQAALARVDGSTVPAVSNDAMAAAKDMNEDDRNAMVRGMVDKLATRLKQNGDDVEGWLRLVRAYMVMGERAKAMSAQAEARQAVSSDAERLRQLNDGLKKLGLDG